MPVNPNDDESHAPNTIYLTTMCSIPGLPTPGSEVPVLITRVNLNPSCGLVELWVNIGDGRKHIYEQMREDIQIPKRKFYGSEEKPGDLCLVHIGDTWHRARIVAIQSETYNVFLIDQGQPYITTSEALAWGQSDSFLLPPEIESCILANVLALENNWPERATKFWKSLPGKKFKGLVQHVLMPDRTILLDIPIVSKHMCKFGVAKKIPVDKFKCLVLKCLHLPKGEASEADRTAQELNLNALKTLSEQIHQHYEESSDSEEAQPQTCRDPCAARGINGRWHRSLLKQNMTSDGAVEVLHVDEGKTELVPVGDIKPLHGKFLRMPVVTYPCSLDGVKDNGTGWTTDQTDYLKSLLLHQTVVARFDHHSIPQDVYYVTLYAANGACINNCFIEKAGLFPPSKTEEDSNVQNEPIPSSFLSSLENKQCLDLQNNVNVNVDGLLEETLPSTKNVAVNGRTDDVPTSSTDDIHIKDCSEHPDPLIQSNGHLSTSFPSDVQNTCDDNVFTVGSSVNVKVSCIESLQKFWCQTTENDDSLRLLMQDLQNHDASVVKTVTCDEEGLLPNVVDIETPSDSACKLLAQKCAQAEAHVQIPPQVLSDAYSYSTHNIEVGGNEIVWVTASENVNQFYCQLDRNFHLLTKIMENVQQLIAQPQRIGHPLGLNSICFARYTDNQWNRGQVVEMSPKFTVHFVDYGQTLAVNESDICPFPTEASIAMSVPVQAVPLGLFDVPAEVPQEVNQWFADHAIGHSLTISVVAKGPKGKLIVELLDGSLNVNVKVREMISKMTQQKMTGLVQQRDQQLANSSKHASVPNQDCLTQELMNISVLTKMTEENKVHSSSGMCATDELKMNSKSITNVSTPEIEHEKTLDEGRKPTLDVILKDKQTVLAETFIQGGHSDSEITQLSLPSCPEGNVNICMYKRPNISLNKTEEVYASCIVGPHYFWCQYTNTEDLNIVSTLAQEVGLHQQDMMFLKTLDPGSPCLALFSSDNQWYRAQVIQRTDNTLHVVFIDYGNESEVDIKDVRPLPQSLLDEAPQAFLCSLNGFDESKGSWDDEVYEEFYNLLVDKPLKVTVFNMEDHSEIVVPQYAVQIVCENIVVNDTMQKYWKPVATEHVMTGNPQTENLLKDGQTEFNMTHLSVSKGNANTCMYKKPNISKSKTEMVYASCIVEPHFFWCQYTNTEELNKVSRLAQEAGQAQQDIMFPKTLGPGSPCLALFSSDKQWYRAQVIRRVDDAFCVVFIDYGNESDVDIKDVRPLPQSLLDEAPQAFLCSLNGFDESKGSWDDEVYEEFYNLLVDKPLKLVMFNMGDHSEIAVPQYAVQIMCENMVVNDTMQKYWKPVATDHVTTGNPQTENLLQDGQTESNITHLSVSKGNANTCMYKKPNISKSKTEMVYASCIVEPHFFWCQYTNTEELNKVSRLAQEAGQAQQDIMFPKTLGPGSPCLALFSSDKQWYRAQVIRRVDDAFCVVFIDYGNESDVDIKDVRPLPQSLLDEAPQAFLCSLNGFDESKGSWDDEVYEEFYNLLVDKPLKLMMFKMGDHSEIAVPQYAVQIECEGAVVNILMEKYWKGLDTDHALAESLGSALDPDNCKCGHPVVTEQS
ncbi:tudor domain-containing 6 isoform X2 [Siniperca chuatsi]|uniref:tudor domain-containing 6 isoform X2 n=1 Tax=Siniperca chuatsi TaxID=119488 RepID=UPI001CE163F7|nr:tudor domain-containing 6 isoform X2 [Siniperca chuatsi]